MAGEKTEKASPKKREDERKKGHIFQSQDIVTSATLICFFAMLQIMGASFGRDMTQGMQGFFENLSTVILGEADVKKQFITVVYISMGVIIPVMIVSIVVSTVATMVQTRLLVSGSQLKPDFSRINPIQGLKRLFSIKSLVELAKAILKITAIGLVIFFELRPQMNKIMLLFDTSLVSALGQTAAMVLDIGFKASAAMLVIGIGDYFFQWWSFERDIKMSKDEIKEEFKQTEGNPETRSRIKGMQRRLSKARMMQAVPEADVVIRNPTHYAVALKYESGGSGAPMLVAKGQDLIALKIIEVAQQHNVFVTENRPLAQALFKGVEIGDEIPAEFYKAVAEVLAYIYRLKRAGRS